MSYKDKIIMGALLSNMKSIREISEELGVSTRTLYRYKAKLKEEKKAMPSVPPNTKKQLVLIEDATAFQMIDRLYDMGFRGTLSQGKLKIVLED